MAEPRFIFRSCAGKMEDIVMTRKWILLAEDNPHDAELAIRALGGKASSDTVILARDGEEVLNCLYRRSEFSSHDETHPTLVLLDLKMPKVDGLEVLRQIKSDSRLKAIPVVMFTSSREQSDLIQTYGLGANAYVVKPLVFQHFMTTIKDIKRFWMTINEPPPEAILEHESRCNQLTGAA